MCSERVLIQNPNFDFFAPHLVSLNIDCFSNLGCRWCSWEIWIPKWGCAMEQGWFSTRFMPITCCSVQLLEESFPTGKFSYPEFLSNLKTENSHLNGQEGRFLFVLHSRWLLTSRRVKHCKMLVSGCMTAALLMVSCMWLCPGLVHRTISSWQSEGVKTIQMGLLQMWYLAVS